MSDTFPMPDLPPELLRAIEAHRNRKRYDDFDLKTLRSIEDSALDQAIMDYVFLRFDQTEGDRRQIVLSLGKGFHICYATWLVEAEVMNGGFNQYFWNSSPEFAEDTPEALKQIGAPRAAELMTSALEVAMREIPEMSRFRKRGDLQAFSDSYKYTDVDGFAEEFCAEAAQFPALRVRYVREHEELFVTM